MLLHHDPHAVFRSLLVSFSVASTLIGVVSAQIGTDPIPGGATWVGTGLLGSVLAWLFFRHLPSKDKQISDLIAIHDQKVKDLTAEFRSTLVEQAIRSAEQDKERRKDYRESLQTVVNHCEKETANTSRVIQQKVDDLVPLANSLRSLIEEFRQERFNGGRRQE